MEHRWSTIMNTSRTNKRLVLAMPPTGFGRDFVRGFDMANLRYAPSPSDVFIGLPGTPNCSYVLTNEMYHAVCKDIVNTHYAPVHHGIFLERIAKHSRSPTPVAPDAEKPAEKPAANPEEPAAKSSKRGVKEAERRKTTLRSRRRR